MLPRPALVRLNTRSSPADDEGVGEHASRYAGYASPQQLAEAAELQRTALTGWSLDDVLLHFGYVDPEVVSASAAAAPSRGSQDGAAARPASAPGARQPAVVEPGSEPERSRHDVPEEGEYAGRSAERLDQHLRAPRPGHHTVEQRADHHDPKERPHDYLPERDVLTELVELTADLATPAPAPAEEPDRASAAHRGRLADLLTAEPTASTTEGDVSRSVGVPSPDLDRLPLGQLRLSPEKSAALLQELSMLGQDHPVVTRPSTRAGHPGATGVPANVAARARRKGLFGWG